MVDSNETLMYESGRDCGYDSGFYDAVERENAKVERLVQWLESKTIKLRNKDSIIAYKTVISKIKEMWEDQVDFSNE
jgi:hypothetical protein